MVFGIVQNLSHRLSPTGFIAEQKSTARVPFRQHLGELDWFHDLGNIAPAALFGDFDDVGAQTVEIDRVTEVWRVITGQIAETPSSVALAPIKSIPVRFTSANSSHKSRPLIWAPVISQPLQCSGHAPLIEPGRSIRRPGR